MASISSTSSLGNTALRGFGGMASGIDRDSIIEKMTLGTTTKINNQKKKITELQWKQEAYRGVSDKIIDWADTYASYTSSKNLKDLNVFAKNQISLRGAETATRFVTATGSSSMVNNISIKGVQQLATSAVLKSESHSSQGGAGIATEVDDLLSKDVRTSNLKGAKLDFAIYDSDGKKTSSATFTFASTYTVQVDGKDVTKNIDYTLETQSLDDLVNILNEHVLGKSEAKVGDANLKDVFEFGNDNGQIVLKKKSGAPEGVVMEGDYALKTLGLDDSQKNEKGKVEFGADGTITMQNKFEDTAINERKMVDYLTGQKMTFNYDGSSKSIELITKEEAAALKGMSESDAKEQMAKNLQNRLNQAFGTGTVKVKFDDVLSFDTEKAGSTVSVMSNNYEMLNNMGLTYGASNKVNLNGKLDQSALSNAFASAGITIPKGDEALNLKINGVEIKGLTGNSSINDILSKINSTTEAGVKATYVESTGEFMLVSSETGAGRQIKLEGEVTNALFGNKQGDGGSTKVIEGQDAKILVNYGGVDVMIERSSNTFNLEGLTVTVSGEFGDVQENADGTWSYDKSQSITFSAKADVEGALERVKGFIEDYNALVTEINNHVRTRPDNNYGALTDEQKAEMDETSIKNWENKAKQGILYGDSAMRDLSMDMESIFTKMLNNGASYEDLKEIGITYAEDWGDGGTLVFDEVKFKTAMENDPEKVSNIFAGGGSVKKGLIDTIDETLIPYATRYGSKNDNGNGKGSYGRLVDIAGSEKKPTTLMENEIYKELQRMQETIDSLNERLKMEQDRYISQFTTMESLINQMNTQSSYLSQLSA